MSTKDAKAFLSGIVALAVVAAMATPASAQLVHRNSDGRLMFNPLICQTDYEIRRTFAAQGYSNIALNAPIQSVIQVRASKGRQFYLIDYNYCLGRVDAVTPIRPPVRSRR